jgi:hypothetical protein
VWTRKFATQTATLDAAEGETWTGKFDAPTVLRVTSDAIYIAGVYTNSYQNGSSPPPGTRPDYVARLDLTGQQLWFRQFLTQPSRGETPSSLAIVGTQLVVYSNIGLAFALNIADGTGP